MSGNDTCAMILGDNICYGNGLGNMLKNADKRAEDGRASVFDFCVNAPERFGVVEVCRAQSLKKLADPRNNYAVTDF